MEHAQQLFVLVSNEELAEEYDYHISVIIEVKDDIPQKIASELEQHVDKAFQSCTGIIIDELRIANAFDITLHDLRTYRKLEYDFRSLPQYLPTENS